MLLKHEFAKALGRMCVLCQTAGQSVSLWLTVWLTIVKWMVGHRRLINRDLSAAPFRGRHSGSSASISPNPLPPPLHVFFYIYRSPLPLLLPGSSISRPMSKSHYDSSVLITITVNNCESAATLWLSRLETNKWFNSSLLPGVEINNKAFKDPGYNTWKGFLRSGELVSSASSVSFDSWFFSIYLSQTEGGQMLL